MRVYAGTRSRVERGYNTQVYATPSGEVEVWPPVAVHSTLPINLGRASGWLKCNDDDDRNHVLRLIMAQWHQLGAAQC